MKPPVKTVPADDLGLAIAKLVVAVLVPAGQPVTVAIDDTLFKRRRMCQSRPLADGPAAGEPSRVASRFRGGEFADGLGERG